MCGRGSVREVTFIPCLSSPASAFPSSAQCLRGFLFSLSSLDHICQHVPVFPQVEDGGSLIAWTEPTFWQKGRLSKQACAYCVHRSCDLDLLRRVWDSQSVNENEVGYLCQKQLTNRKPNRLKIINRPIDIQLQKLWWWLSRKKKWHWQIVCCRDRVPIWPKGCLHFLFPRVEKHACNLVTKVDCLYADWEGEDEINIFINSHT